MYGSLFDLSPVGHDAGVVALLVVVHARVAHAYEGAVLAVGTDDAGARDGLREVGVDGRAAHRLKPLQLARRGHVEPLGGVTEQEEQEGVDEGAGECDWTRGGDRHSVRADCNAGRAVRFELDGN